MSPVHPRQIEKNETFSHQAIDLRITLQYFIIRVKYTKDLGVDSLGIFIVCNCRESEKREK